MNTFTKSCILALFLFASVASAIDNCDDDSNFQFGSFLFNGKNIVRNCAWLTENTEAVQRRKLKWCDQQWRHVKVGEKCPQTCEIVRCRLGLRPGCTMDYPRNWSDADGLDCGWYERGITNNGRNNNCRLFGDGYEASGFTANSACCTCGGGCRDKLRDSPSQWHDSTGTNFDCAWYAEDTERCNDRSAERFRNKGYIANEACCACGGGDQVRNTR